MSTSKVSIDEPITVSQHEIDLLTKKLNDRITSKMQEGDLTFTQEKVEPLQDSLSSSAPQKTEELTSEGEGPRPTTIDLSHFGLRNPDDLRVFLLSPAGVEVTNEIATEVVHERAAEEIHQMQIQEELIMEERRRGMLFRWLMEDDKESKKAQDELIDMQEKALQEKAATPAQTALKTDKKPSNTYSGYMDALKKRETELDNRSQKLATEGKQLTEKHDTYNKNFDEFYSSAQKYEKITTTKGDIQKEIKKLQKEADDLADQISNTGDDEQAYRLGHQLNAVSFKIANLEDLLARKTGDKKFVDAEGKAASFKNAAFIIPKNQQIKKVGNEYFLLEKGQNWDKMSAGDKKKAKAAYQKAKDDIRVVRDVVNDVNKQELDAHETQVAQHKTERLLIQQEKNVMLQAQAKNANAKSMDNPIPLGEPNPTQVGFSPGLSLVTPSKSTSQKNLTITPTPTPVFKAGFIRTEFEKQPAKTWGNLFKVVDNISSPAAKKEAEKYLLDKGKDQLMKDGKLSAWDKLNVTAEKIKEWIKNAPVPDETMRDFIQHMETFGKNAYEVGDQPSPLEQQKQSFEEVHDTNPAPSA
ncbi:MAG: hypothetical protein ACRCXC_12325 [Legionella sp.]